MTLRYRQLYFGNIRNRGNVWGRLCWLYSPQWSVSKWDESAIVSSSTNLTLLSLLTNHLFPFNPYFYNVMLYLWSVMTDRSVPVVNRAYRVFMDQNYLFKKKTTGALFLFSFLLHSDNVWKVPMIKNGVDAKAWTTAVSWFVFLKKNLRLGNKLALWIMCI